MTYVYLLSDYDEHGAENLVATLDRDKLTGMVGENWAPLTLEEMLLKYPWYEKVLYPRYLEQNREWIEKGVAGLTELLKRSDEDLAKQKTGHNCHDGWGGMQLHVVELK